MFFFAQILTQSQRVLFLEPFEQRSALSSVAVNNTNYFEHSELIAYLKHHTQGRTVRKNLFV